MRITCQLPLVAVLPLTAVHFPCAPCASAAVAQEPEQADQGPGPTHFTPHLLSIHGLESPVAVAYDAQGLLWIVEAGADRIRAFDAEGNEKVTLGARGSGAAELLAPGDVAVTDDGTVFVADTGNHRVSVFDSAGVPVTTWGALGSADGALHSPAGIDVHGDRVAVADTGNDRVQLFERTGEHLATIAGFGHGMSELARPEEVAFGPDGELYVTDADHHRVSVFDADGKHLRTFGEWGFFPGLFSNPAGIATRDGRVFVADTENHRVQVFDTGGELLYRCGLHAIIPREGRGRLHYPTGVAVSANGQRIAIAEPYDDRVQILGRAPGATPPEPIGGAGQASPHYGFRIDVDGQLATIVEPETHAVGVYDLRLGEPVRVGVLGGYGRSLGLFNRPTGAFIDQASLTVLVCDAGGRRLHEARLRIDLTQELRQLPELGTFVKMLDFQRLGRGFADVPLAFPVEPLVVQRASNGEVFVLDEGNERVLVFDASFEFLRSFGGHGTGPGQLRRPTDLQLAHDEQRIFVVDSHNRRVIGYSLAGEVLITIGVAELQEPSDVALDPEHGIFVTDVRRHQVLRFEGEELRDTWGERGIQRMHFLKPRGLDLDGEGRLIVIDHGNHRGTIMTTAGEYTGSFGSRFYTKPARRPDLFKREDYVE